MKKSEAALLLALAATFDQRTIGRSDVEAWSSALAEVPWDESTRQAIVDFYSAPASDYDRDSRRFIQAHHVRAGRSRIRERRIDAVTQPVPNVVDGVTYFEELRAVRRAIADGLIRDEAGARAYEQSGQSYHLAYQRGERLAIEAPPDAQPLRHRPVDQALEGVFPSAPPADLRRALSASSPRRSDLPKWTTVACPTCGALPGDLCVIPETDPPRKRSDPHGTRRRAAFPPPGAEASA